MMALRFLFVSLLFLMVTPSGGHAQETDPDDEWGPAWHDPQEISSIEEDDPGTLTLTAAQGAALRRAVQRSLRRGTIHGFGRLSPVQQRALRRRQVGPLWLSEDGEPRLGSFWVQRQTDRTMLVSETLFLGSNVRIMLNITLTLRQGRWRIRRTSVSLVHRRRRH